MGPNVTIKLKPEHERLVEVLSGLPEDERRAVVAAAEAAANGGRVVASWATIRGMSGVVSIGGDSIKDCERLYDG